MHNNDRERDQEQLYDADLDIFNEQEQQQVYRRVQELGRNIDHIEDLNAMFRKEDEEKGKRQMTEAERQARQLRRLDSEKYFSRIKLLFLKELGQFVREVRDIQSNCWKEIAKYLSALDEICFKQYLTIRLQNAKTIDLKMFCKFMRNAKESIEKKCIKVDANILLWTFCEFLSINCRKIHFFDLAENVDEAFYQLRYDLKANVSKKGKGKQTEMQKIKLKLARMIREQTTSHKQSQYENLEDYEFDPLSLNRSQEQQTKQRSLIKGERQKNNIRKETFKTNYFQLYSVNQQEWVLVNSQILELETLDNLKENILEFRSIIGFYSTKILHFKPEFKQLCSFRKMKNIELRDLTMYFSDDYARIMKRRKRCGCKNTFRNCLQLGSYITALQLLTDIDRVVMIKDSEAELIFHLNNFPKDKTQMLVSEVFVVPSLLPQYSLLNATAKPLDIVFKDEKVYLKKDVISVTSRMGWIDRGRKVKRGQLAVKKTQNKIKKLTELFLYQQTEPFSLELNPQTGDFILDEYYNNIYVPPNFVPPQPLIILDKKINYVCNKAKIRHAEVIQGFKKSVGRALPNSIGYLIYKQDQVKIEQLYEERQEYWEQTKQARKRKELVAKWNKLFKMIELSLMYVRPQP